MHKFARISGYSCTSLLNWRNFEPVPSTETPHLDLLFAGSVFCDLVFAGVPTPEPGAEVYAERSSSPRAAWRTGPWRDPGWAPGPRCCPSSATTRSASTSWPLLAAEPDLDLSWLRCTPGFQSPVTVSLTGMHEREFITYQEEADPLEWPIDRPSVGATHVSMQRDLPDWVARLRQEGTVVYGGVGWDSSGEWSREVLRRLDQIDVFVPNDLEAMRYTQTDDAYAAARELGRYVELAVVTRGARGVIAYERSTGQLTEVPSVKVAAIDPTGAGDVFVAPSWPAACWTGRSSSGYGWPASPPRCRSARSAERRAHRIPGRSRSS